MTSKTGSLDCDVYLDYNIFPDYSKIDQALRRNGIAVMHKGNRNKLSMGKDGKKLVVYGNAIYSSDRDKGFRSDDPFANKVVDIVKGKVEHFKTLPESPNRSHHTGHEKTTGHHTGREKTTGHHKKKG